MRKSKGIAAVWNAITKSFHWLKKAFEAIESFLGKVGSILSRGTGLLICLGGLSATVGWLLASLRPDPLGQTWTIAIWLVIGGVFALVIGILALTTQHVLRIGMIGQYGIIIFLLGAMVVLAGATAVDLFILPWMAKLFSSFPNLGSILQGSVNTVTGGVNTATSTIVNTGSDICNTISNPFGGSNSCSTSSPKIPDAKVPSLGIDDILKKICLPSMSTLGTLGLIFLSGAPLAPGCLLVGIVFLMAGVKPRSALLLLILAAFLNLGGQFFLHVAFLGPGLGVLLFLALAWLGFSLWAPWKVTLPRIRTRKKVAAAD